MARDKKIDHPKFGRKLRYARRMKGLKLAEVAEMAGCSESQLSKIENDQTTPSVQLLHNLAKALDTNMAWLFTAEDDERKVVTRVEDRRAVNFSESDPVEGIKQESLAPYFSGNLLQAMLFSLEPNGSSTDQITHIGEDFGYVLEGEFTLLVDGVEHLLNEGDCFHFNSERPHGYRNSSDRTAKVIWVNTPPTY